MTSINDNRIHYLVSTVVLIFSRFAVAGGGFAVVVLVASTYGATTETDAYFIARLVPVTLVAPIAMAYNLAFVPIYTTMLAEQGKGAAAQLAGDFLKITLAVSLILAIGYAALADWIVVALAPGFSPAAHESAVWMTRIMAAAIVLTSLHAVFDSVLNADRRFVLSALSSLWIPGGSLCGVLALAKFWGITGLAIGVSAGFALQAVVLVPIMEPYFRRGGWRVDLSNPVLRRAVKDLGLTILILAASQVTVAVDRLFATLLGEGEVSSLSLGFVLIGLVPFLVAAPVYKVMYPELIRLVAANRPEALRKCLSGNLLLVAFLTFPVAAGLAIFSGTITELVFLYGRFSETAASQTAEVIFYLALGLPAGVGVILVFYYFLLTKQAGLLLKVLAVAILANTLLDWVLMSLLGIGGIALTSSLIALIRTWALTLLAARMLGGPIFAGLGVPVGKLLAATLLAGLTMYGTAELFDRVAIAGTAAQIGILATAAILGATVYLAANHMLRNQQLRQLLVCIRQPEAAA